jgi:hypothetical protein
VRIHDGERARPDRPGGAENRDALHAAAARYRTTV